MAHDDHKHEHHDHGHGEHHHHHHAPAAEAKKYPRTLSGAWTKALDDTKSIFEKGINRNAISEAHGDHFHLNNKVTDISKVAMLAGATVSLGVAIHGVRNIKRGVAGWEDKELGENHKPSVQYTVIGAAETVGGLALMKRMLTGTVKIF